MATADDIKKELAYLLDQESSLQKHLNSLENLMRFGDDYQKWYTRATKIIDSIAPDRSQEFASYYRTDPKRKELGVMNYVIQDLVNGYAPLPDRFGKKPYDELGITKIRLLNQMQILASVASRLDHVLADVRGALLAELEDGELRAAEKLLSVNLRAAGALAGVVLERHLQRVAENHGIVIKKKDPTIADLNDPLKEKDVYTLPVWRKIQLLADLRNLCVHKKSSDPKEDQVRELIDGVNAIVKSVF